jgi:hypothetical protein
MPTLTDLKGAFELLEHVADTHRPASGKGAELIELPERVHAGSVPTERVPSAERNRRVLSAVGGVIVVAAMIAGLVLLDGGVSNQSSSGNGSTGPVQPTPSVVKVKPAVKGPSDLQWVCAPNAAAVPLTTLASIAPVRGYDFGTTSLCATGQRNLIDATEAAVPWTGYLSVYQAGQYDPATARKGRAVSVNGRPGWYGLLPETGKVANVTSPDCMSATPDPNPPKPGWQTTQQTCRSYSIVWEYAPGRWAAVVDESSTAASAASRLAALLSVASKVNTSDPTPVGLPFRLGYVPPDLIPMSALRYYNPAHPELWSTGGQLGLGTGHPTATTATTATTDCELYVVCQGASLTVVVDATTHRHGVDNRPSTPITVSGQPGTFYPQGSDEHGYPALDIQLGDFELQIIVSPAAKAKYPVSELIKMASQVSFPSNGNDDRTWFPASSVVP